MSYASPEDFKKTFIEPFKTTAGAITGHVAKMSSKIRTAVMTFLDSAMSTVNWWYHSRYDKIIANDKKRSQAIVQQYQQFFRKVDETFENSGDFHVLAFAANPGAYFATNMVNNLRKGKDLRIALKALFGLDIEEEVDAEHLREVEERINKTEIAKRIRSHYIEAMEEDSGEIHKIIKSTNKILAAQNLQQAARVIQQLEDVRDFDMSRLNSVLQNKNQKEEEEVLRALKTKCRAEAVKLLKNRAKHHYDSKEMRAFYDKAVNSIMHL